MGDVKSYNSSGGFDQYLYRQVGETITASNGVQGKVITSSADDNMFHDSLPFYSNTSEVYFKVSDETKQIEQARIYKERKVALDFDWDHTHKPYEKGVVHVHEWHMNKKGEWKRSRTPRFMNDEEMKRYGELIKKANPKAKLRP